MTKFNKKLNSMRPAMVSYYTYAALYFEGYYCCAKPDVPTV